MKFIPLIFFAFLLVLNCTASDSPTAKSNHATSLDQAPSRWQLRRNFYDKGEILVIYDAEDKDIKSEYGKFLGSLTTESLGRRFRNIQIKHKASNEVSDDEIKNSVLFLVGAAQSNTLIKRLSKDLPFHFSKEGIRFNDKEFYQDGDVLSFSYYPNPENNELPFLLLTGNDDANILQFLKDQQARQRFISQSMDFEIYRNNTKIVVGGFDRNWGLSDDAYFDFSKGKESVLSTELFEFVSHDVAFEDGGLNTLSALMEESVHNIQAFSGNNKALPNIKVHLYKTAEEKGLLLGNTHQAHFDFESQVSHIVYNDKYKNNFLQKENIFFLRELIGETTLPWLEEGLAVYFTNHYQREGYRYWAARLAESQNALPLAHFFDEGILEYESPIILESMSAALVSFLVDHWGKDAFISKYKDWNSATTDELKKLEKEWQSYLAKLVKQHPKKVRKQIESTYLKGFNFAHEGYSIYNGYLSNLATKSLEKQAGLGANAIAIVPYTGMRNPKKAVPLRISRNAGSENVQGIVHSAYEAKQLGMASMLKPQIWLRGSWPGDIKMDSQEEWDAFFEYYHRWIKHFALIAEIHDIEMFCVGVEFAYASLQQEEKWREIFRSVRRLYQGKITYAANWGYEFEQVQFWDELDFIGLNCYYPLSKSDKPSDKDLRENFKRVKDKIRKVHIVHKKPIVFTEIGFRSTEMPWKNPHAEEDFEISQEDQARCYEVIFDGIQDESWCQGILWWKFPSYIDHRGVDNNAFTPNNKKAEKVVKKWFAK